jgi:aryl-alcohol dehydrogenase-like predicted oxidoreductase
MASGLLSGRFDRDRLEGLPPDDMRRGRAEFAEPWLSKNLALVERLRVIAGQLECSVAELAIAWTLAQDGVTGAIVGARRPDQVGGWLGAGNVQLTGERVRAIDDAIAETGAGTSPPAPPPSGT